MVPRLSAVVQNIRIHASGFFEGVGKDRKVGEVAVIVDRLSELPNSAVPPLEPGRVNERLSTEWDGPEEIIQYPTLGYSLNLSVIGSDYCYLV
jgi:hypothetical protein